MQRLLHSAYSDAQMVERDPAALDEVRAAGGWFWLDCTTASADEVMETARIFDIDLVAVEDILAPTEFPKVEELEHHLFVIIHGLSAGTTRIATVELDAFIGEGYLVTFHREQMPALDWVMAEAQASGPRSTGGPDRMFARVAEAGVRRFLPLIDGLERRIEELEDIAFAADPQVLSEVQALRRDVTVLRRIAGPQRDVFRDLSRVVNSAVTEHTRRRFSDVFDHQSRVVESLDTARSLLSSVVETYRSTVAESMNDVMKVLTVFTAILMPLTLMAGVYGMNFANMPELQWRIGYYVLLGIMAVTAISLWIYFSRRGFIGGPRLSTLPRAVGKGLVGLVDLTLSPLRVLGSAVVHFDKDDTD